MPVSVSRVPRGRAFEILDRSIAEAQADDPFAAVTVITPSARAAIHLGRDLSDHRGRAGWHGVSRGLVNVNFVTLSRIAEDLGESGLRSSSRRRLTRTILMAAIRAELATHPRIFGAATLHASTASEVTDRYGELRFAGQFPVVDSAGHTLGARAMALRRICDAVRMRVEAFSYDDVDLFESAVDALRLGATRELGSVIVYLPERARPCEIELVRALSERLSVAVMFAYSGVDEAEGEAPNVLAERISRALGVAVIGSSSLESPASALPDRVVVAPSPRSEARTAVRIVLERLEAGVEPARIALLIPVREPYLGLVTGELAAAGISYNAPSSTHLRDEPSGRVIISLMRLAAGPIRRHDLMSLLRAAPVLGVDGARAPVAEWDRVSRLAGIAEGSARSWSQRLRDYAAYRDRELEPGPDDHAGNESGNSARHRERSVAAALGLAEFVDHLEERLATGRAAKGWDAISRWATAALDTLLGEAAAGPEGDGAPAGSRDLADALLAELGALDSIEPAQSLAEALPVMVEELRRVGQRTGAMGSGVVVASLDQVMAIDLDVAVLVGCSAAHLPGGVVRSPLLDHADRSVLGLDPVTPGAQAARVKGHLGMLRQSTNLFVATAPALDESGREMGLSRFVNAAPTVSAIDGLVAELHATIAEVPARSLVEIETALLFDTAPASVGARADELGLVDVSLASAAVASREQRQFGPYQGLVGKIDEPVDQTPYSPTSIEEVATCPFRYFLSHVLRCEAIEDPEVATSIDPRARGSIVHETLERFVAEEISGELSPVDGKERLAAIADEVIGSYERAGKTGKRVLFHAERRRMKQDLEAERMRDLVERSVSGRRPLGVEYGFGYGEVPPVSIETGERTVAFRGKIDRADVADDGSIVVIDYKTGRPAPFEAILADPVDAGRHLQLPIYALAATRLSSSLTARVRAEFRFVGSRATSQGEFSIGLDLDEAVNARLTETVAVLTGTVAEGLFPMVPGVIDRRGYQHCQFCDFKAVCPSGRDRYEESARKSARTQDYFDLVGGLGDEAGRDTPDEWDGQDD